MLLAVTTFTSATGFDDRARKCCRQSALRLAQPDQPSAAATRYSVLLLRCTELGRQQCSTAKCSEKIFRTVWQDQKCWLQNLILYYLEVGRYFRNNFFLNINSDGILIRNGHHQEPNFDIAHGHRTPFTFSLVGGGSDSDGLAVVKLGRQPFQIRRPKCLESRAYFA